MKKKKFSIAPINKQTIKKVLDHFDEEGQKVNGDDVRGGNWTELGSTPDKEDINTHPNR